MIVDFLLDGFFEPLHWFLGLLPDAASLPFTSTTAGTAYETLRGWWRFADYFLPIGWMLSALALLFSLLFLIGVVRWLLRFIPGMGG